jgi:tRNA(Arg) A34 adenosine deaminase TadA
MPSEALSPADAHWLRQAIDQSRQAATQGHQPYGAVLVGPQGAHLWSAHNTQGDAGDITGHAELNLVRQAAAELGAGALAGGTVYASGEPCPMCAGALYWAGVSRVVFALGLDSMRDLNGADSVLAPGCAEVMRGGTRQVIVDGPALEDEARAVFRRA